MVKNGFVTYKVYRLIDPRYSLEHDDYVRYVGVTYRELKKRLWEHNRYSPTSDLESGWFEVPTLKIQLVESVDTESEAKSRESYWIELHQKAGYNLLNVCLMQGTAFPEKLKDPAKMRKEIESKVKGLAQEAALRAAFAEHKRRYREWLVSARDDTREE